MGGGARVRTAAALAAMTVAIASCGDDDRTAAEPPLNPPPAKPTVQPEREPGAGTELEEAEPSQLGFPDPDDLRPNSAPRALAEFMTAWRDRAWDRMATWTTQGFLARSENAAAALRDRFGERRLRGYVVRRSRLQPTRARMRVLLEFRGLRPRLRREVLVVPLRRQDPNGLPTRSGRWGVDPEGVRALGGG